MYTTSSLAFDPQVSQSTLEAGRSEVVIQLLSRYLSCTLQPHYLQGLQVYFCLCSKLLLKVSALFTFYLYQKGLNFYGELLVDATSLNSFRLLMIPNGEQPLSCTYSPDVSLHVELQFQLLLIVGKVLLKCCVPVRLSIFVIKGHHVAV